MYYPVGFLQPSSKAVFICIYYMTQDPNLLGNIMVAVFVTVIATMSIGALLGSDVINPNAPVPTVKVTYK